jgi:large subunit ribosomal protein L30
VRQRQTLRALGLTRLGKTVVVRDNPPNRGRVRMVQHLVDVES